MTQPTIVYGTLEQPLHPNAQYLLMRAGLGNGEYPAQQFIQAINGVPLDDIRKDECRRDVSNQRNFLTTFAQMGQTVTIKDFTPHPKELEAFVDATFKEMHDRMQAKR